MIDGKIKQIKNPDPLLITEKMWKFILNLECTDHAFEGLPTSILNEY
jgi:hypothetical protein